MAQAPSLNGQYIPPPYDFSGYHHFPGVGDPSTSSWNSVYTPREEYPYSFPGSSPGAGQVSFSSPEIGGTPTASGGSSFTPFNFFTGQDTFCSRRKPHEPIRPSVAGGTAFTSPRNYTGRRWNLVMRCIYVYVTSWDIWTLDHVGKLFSTWTKYKNDWTHMQDCLRIMCKCNLISLLRVVIEAEVLSHDKPPAAEWVEMTWMVKPVLIDSNNFNIYPVRLTAHTFIKPFASPFRKHA